MKGGAAPYRKGYRAELRAIHYLEGLGYFVVPARGSRGPIDFVAFPTIDTDPRFRYLIRLIQVKSGKKPVTQAPAELQALSRQIADPRVLVELWVYRDRKGTPSIEQISWENLKTD